MEARRLEDGPIVASGPVNRMRDPAVFDDGTRPFPLSTVSGESGIAIAELDPGAG